MTDKPPNKPNNYKLPALVKEILFFAVTGLLILIANEILKALFPKLSESLLNLIGYLLLLLLIALYVFFRTTKLTKNKLRIFYGVVLGIAILASAYFLISNILVRQTVYFVIDLSEGMGDSAKEVRAKLKLNENSILSNRDVGLAVFGGGIHGKHGCDDIEELVFPAQKSESLPKIYGVVDTLIDIQPIGPSNIQNSVLFAIERLKSRPGIQRIVLITSSANDYCSSLDKQALDSFAALNNVEYELVVLTVGKVSEEDITKLTDYATNKSYVNAENAEQLPEKLEVIINAPAASNDLYYFGYYGYIPNK